MGFLIMIGIAAALSGGDNDVEVAGVNLEAEDPQAADTALPPVDEQFEMFVADELDGTVVWSPGRAEVTWHVSYAPAATSYMAKTLEEAQRLDLGLDVRFSAYFTFVDQLGNSEDAEGFWLRMPWETTASINFDHDNIFIVATSANYAFNAPGLRDEYEG